MRLIDADALREWLIRAGRFLKIQDDRRSAAHAVGKIIDHLDRMPTVDAVPVCRCEKCVYWDAGTRRHNSNDAAEWDEAICDKYHEIGLSCDVWTATDDFCSYGERKGGNE